MEISGLSTDLLVRDSINRKTGGSWVDPATWTPHGKVDGSWRTAKNLWGKSGGTWQNIWTTPVPSNVLILYDDSSEYAPGSTAWASVDSTPRVPYPVSTSYTPGTTGGATSHAGSLHGGTGSYLYSGSSYYATNQRMKDRSVGTGSEGGVTGSTHGHSMSSSSYSITASSGNCEKASFCRQCRLGGSYLPAGAILMHYGAYTWSKWTSYSTSGYWLQIWSTTSNTSHTDYSSHNHLSGTSRTTNTVYNTSTYKMSIYNGFPYKKQHYHLLSINTGNSNADYRYQYLQFYQLTQDATWDELPSGTVCIITDTTWPTGWPEWTGANTGYVPRSHATSTSKGGGWSHTHSTWLVVDDDWATSWDVRAGTDAVYAMVHTADHGFSYSGGMNSANHYVPYIYVHLIKKT
jgi:hypothetical protein